jgi:hypothetical protein
MSPFEVYQLYISLKNHFNTEKYDYFKYNGKGGISRATFDKRKDKIFFEKLAKHRDPKGLLVANFVKNPKSFIRDIAYSEDCEQTYLDWKKRQQALTYTISNDIIKLNDKFNENFIVRKNEHPLLLRLFSSGVISTETFCILVDISKCYSHWNKSLDGDIIWKEISLLLRKYTPFIECDKDKIKSIVFDNFLNRA